MSSPAPQSQSQSQSQSQPGGLRSLDTTVGALFFATLCSMALWGAGTIQLYFYYNNYRKDSRWLKIYIFVLWLFDSSHQGLLIGMAHRYLIAGFGDYEGLMELDRLLVSALLVGGFICLMVQSIFILRIWRLSEKNFFIVGFISSLVLAQFVATCLYFVRGVQSQTFAHLMSAMVITRIVNSVTAAADSMIALCLVVLLHRTRSGFKESDTTINRLILFTINTGAVTSVCAILGLVLGFVLFNTLCWMFFYLMVSRLYMNSLLAALNSRNSLRRSLIKGSTSLGIPNSTTEIFKTVARQTHFDDYGLVSPAPGARQQRSVANTNATQSSAILDSTVISPFSEDSFYSRSMYSVHIEDLQYVPPSGETTLTKTNIPRSTDNWI